MFSTLTSLAFTLAGLAEEAPDFAAIISNITSGLQPVFLPIAGLSLTVFFLLMAGAPIFGDATSQYKGFFMKVCLIVTTIGLVPSLLTWLYGLGQGASGNEEGFTALAPMAFALLRPLASAPTLADEPPTLDDQPPM